MSPPGPRPGGLTAAQGPPDPTPVMLATMADERPDEPISPLVEAAVHLHEMYRALLAAGFTVDEALRIVAYSITSKADPTQEG